jgi:Fur family ferric uptake transcriptional regulator
MHVNSNKTRPTRARERAADAIAQFRRYLVGRHMRFTAQRALIVEDAFSRGGHFSVDELYTSLRATGKDVSRSTVYRTLKHLCRCGMLKQVLQGENEARYETVYGREHHDHLVCVKCGRAIEFRDERIERLQQLICRRHNFRSLEHRLGIRGICARCRAEEGRR